MPLRKQKGQVLIFSLIFMLVILVVVGALLGFVHQNTIGGRRALAQEQALQLAEAGIDKAVRQLNQSGGSYLGETGTVLGTGVFDVSIATISATVKEITATGHVPNKVNPIRTKQIKVQVTGGATSVSFNYGVQVGEGGARMSNNARINGSIYSNGVIDGSSNARITGDAYSAGASGRLTDRLQIDAHAHAHQIDTNLQIGGNAYGYAMSQVTVGGNVYTNSISNCTVGGNASFTTKSSCTIAGNQITPYPGEPDPPILPLPITQAQIDDWKNQAEAGGTITGSYTLTNGAQASLGPKKITGDLILSNLAQLTLTGTLWVVGNIGISNGSGIRLDSSYGTRSEVIVNDGWIHMTNNGTFSGSGTAGSYLMFLSTSPCVGSGGGSCTHHDAAIDLHNNATGAIIYAQNGMVNLHNNVQLKEITAYKLEMDNNATVTYESGLSNVNFSAGPGGGWQIIRGTWREIK